MKLALLTILFALSGFVLENSQPTEASHLGVDAMGNYFLYTSRIIEKWSPQGQLVFRTADLNQGSISALDLTNPLKPFLFYKDQGKVVMLDNTLSQQGETIDLFSLGWGQIECIAGSRGDAYWLWDVSNAELVKVNERFERLASSGNVGVLLGASIYPDQIIERGQHVYVTDAILGILVFDIYGNYRTRLSIQIEGDLHVIDDNLIYIKEKRLHVLEPDLISETTLDLPREVRGDFGFVRNKLFVLQDGILETYQMQP